MRFVLKTAIDADPNAGSVWERLKTMDDAYTATRAGYLDNLPTILTDTAALDTSTELRTLLYGSDTAGATAANQSTIITSVQAIDTATELRTLLYGSDTAGATAAALSTASGYASDAKTAAGKLDTASELRTLLWGSTVALRVDSTYGSILDPNDEWFMWHGDSSGAGSTAADVWTYGTRILTALDEDTTTLDLNGTTIGTVTTLTGHTPQTADHAANITSIKTSVEKIDSANELRTFLWGNTTALRIDSTSGAVIDANDAQFMAHGETITATGGSPGID